MLWNRLPVLWFREKIPDRLIDEADEIELVDLPADELLKRLRDGKVYVSDQAMRALEKFFRKGNLTALREISLRRAADRVDSQMLSYMKTKDIPGPWPAAERILVCISSHPMGERLIRSGRRLADDLNAEWYVLYVETHIICICRLATRCGCSSFLPLQRRWAPKYPVSRVNLWLKQSSILPGSIISRKLWPENHSARDGMNCCADRLLIKSFATAGQLMFMLSAVLRQAHQPSILKANHHATSIRNYGFGILLVIGVTLFGLAVDQFIHPTNLVMVYLLAVVISAVYLGRGPAIVTSLLGVLAFDFFFINPIFTFTVNDTQYILTFMGLLIVGLIISSSAALLRDQVTVMRKKEYQTQALFNLSRELTGALSMEQVLEIAEQSITSILERKSVILLPENGILVSKHASGDFGINENEFAVAEWSYKHGQPAGHGTETLPAAAIRFVPLNSAHGPVGVIGIKPGGVETSLTNDQRMLLNGLANLIAQAIERVQLVNAATQSEMLRNTEKLQAALLNSISHELRTPLASIIGVLTSLVESEKSPNSSQQFEPETKIELLDSATDQARQLNRLVENLLNMTRLEAGGVHLNLSPCDIQDLIGSVLHQFSSRLKNYPLRVEIPDDLPAITCDAILIAQVIMNLIDNACKYSPAGSPITIGAQVQDKALEIFVRDSGKVYPTKN